MVRCALWRRPLRHSPRVAIEVGKHRYPIEVHELTETLPFSDEEIAAWRNEWRSLDRSGQMPPPHRKRRRATGRLSLVFPNGYAGGRTRWTEGPRGRLEYKLASVFETLTKRASDDDRQAAEAARRTEELRREQAAYAETERRRRIERERAERLTAEADAHDQALQVRRYIAALRGRLAELPNEERDRVASWCHWAESWLEASDPAISTRLIIGFDRQRDERDR